MTVNDDNLIDEANLLADALCKTSISDHKQQQTLVDSMLDNLINSTQENSGSTKALKVRGLVGHSVCCSALYTQTWGTLCIGDITESNTARYRLFNGCNSDSHRSRKRRDSV